MKRDPRASAFIFPALLCAALIAGCSEKPRELLVTYYYQPGCTDCTHAQTEVASLESDFPGQVRVESLDASSPEAEEMTKRLGFKEHGLVIRSHRGAVLYKATDHKLKVEDVRQEIKNQIAFQEASL